MPRINCMPQLNISSRVLPKLGEGRGECVIRYYENNKQKYISYQYGYNDTYDEAYKKCESVRERLISTLEAEVKRRKAETKQKYLARNREQYHKNKPTPQKRGRKPLTEEQIEERKANKPPPKKRGRKPLTEEVKAERLLNKPPLQKRGRKPNRIKELTITKDEDD